MLTRRAASGTKTGHWSVAVVGMLLGASTLSPAAGADYADASSSGTLLYAYFREPEGEARSAPRPYNLDVHLSGQLRALTAPHRPGSAPSLAAPVDAPVSELLARLHSAFGRALVASGEAVLRTDRAVLFGNADAFVRTKMPLALGEQQRAFVYADMGATDSALKWQGLAGIHAREDVDLVGGWRHVTYHFSPGNGVDSLDFNGPFLGATLAW